MVAATNPGRPLTVEAHIGLVHRVVKRFRWAIGPALDEDDLAQAGAIGLMRALETYDPSSGYALSTFATPWIKHHIRRAIENQRRLVRVPVHVQTRVWKTGEAIPANALSLDAPMQRDNVDSGAWVDNLVPQEGPCDAAEQIADQQRRAAVTSALQKLPVRIRAVLLARFRDELTLQQIGNPMGVSRERVRQLVEIGLAQLRDAFSKAGVSSLQQL